MSEKEKKENIENTEEQEPKRSDMLINRLEDKDFSTLTDDINKVVAKKIQNRVQAKKEDVINKLNGVTTKEKEEENDTEE